MWFISAAPGCAHVSCAPSRDSGDSGDHSHRGGGPWTQLSHRIYFTQRALGRLPRAASVNGEQGGRCVHVHPPSPLSLCVCASSLLLLLLLPCTPGCWHTGRTVRTTPSASLDSTWMHSPVRADTWGYFSGSCSLRPFTWELVSGSRCFWTACSRFSNLKQLLSRG